VANEREFSLRRGDGGLLMLDVIFGEPHARMVALCFAATPAGVARAEALVLRDFGEAGVRALRKVLRDVAPELSPVLP
jgi:hypothetical protein